MYDGRELKLGVVRLNTKFEKYVQLDKKMRIQSVSSERNPCVSLAAYRSVVGGGWAFNKWPDSGRLPLSISCFIVLKIIVLSVEKLDPGDGV